MRLGEALATCPRLVLVERDPAAVEQEWEGLLRRLEDAGFAVEPLEPGVVVFETTGVERLYGGVEAALRKALASVGPAWDPRAGAGQRRFVALAAASVARAGQAVIVEGKEEQAFLEPLPLTLLPLARERYAELEGLGVRRLGELARLPGGAVAERLGPEGKRAWSLARGGERRRVRGRSPAAELAEALSFPEAVANELTLRRALAALLDRLREPAGACRQAVPQGGALRAAGRRRLLAAHGDAARGDGRSGPPASGARAEARRDPRPVVELRLEAVQLADRVGDQLALVAPEGEELDLRLREGLQQVSAGVGAGSVCAVVEVAPWSRIPEARALVVPRGRRGRGRPRPTTSPRAGRLNRHGRRSWRRVWTARRGS